MSWAESKWVVDNILQKIGQAPNNMRAFAAFATSKTSVGLKFLEPEDSYADGNLICSVGGVMIRKSETGYPANTTEGELVIDNKNLGAYATEAFIVDGLTEGTKYYFSAFPYSTQGVYNLSTNESNRANASPADGEKVVVNINIDNTAGFNSATVTCVNETDPNATKSATITPTQRTANFTVPIGNRYHLEYGAVDGYSKPDNTASKVSVAGSTTTYEATGTCNNVPNLTGRPSGTDGKVDVVWRGIEGLWGNVWEWVDGVNWNNGSYYVCNDPSKYADDTGTNYQQLSFVGVTNWSSSYITTEGLDTGSNAHVMLPSAAGSGSESTYMCDACWSSTGWRVFLHGGYWVNGSLCGLFTASLYYTASGTYTGVGSRLLYIPS